MFSRARLKHSLHRRSTKTEFITKYKNKTIILTFSFGWKIFTNDKHILSFQICVKDHTSCLNSNIKLEKNVTKKMECSHTERFSQRKHSDVRINIWQSCNSVLTKRAKSGQIFSSDSRQPSASQYLLMSSPQHSFSVFWTRKTEQQIYHPFHATSYM